MQRKPYFLGLFFLLISSHMLFRYSFLDLCVVLFSSFVSLLWFFLLVGYILPFPLFLLLSISCVIHGFLACLSTIPVTSLIVSSTCSTALPKFSLVHSFTPGFCSRVSCTFCHLACYMSRSHLGFCLELYDFLQSNADLHNHLVVVSISVCFRHCLCMLHTVSESMPTSA